MHTIRAMPTFGIGRLLQQLPIRPTRHENTMTASRKRFLIQPFGRIAAVGAATLLLAGSLAPSVAARPRNPANSYIQMCFESNGNPYYFEFAGVWAVGCEYADRDNVDTGSRNAVNGEHHTVGDRGAADAGDHGRQKAHKQHKNTHHAGKHGHKHRR